MKIVVLAGGLSPERDVSFSSGSLIANALMDSGNEVLLADLYEGVENPESAEFRRAEDGKRFSFQVPDTEPDLEALVRAHGGRRTPVGPHILELCRRADVTFLALHGGVGENGQLQAVLDSVGVRYTGSGFLGCALAMDKDVSKRLMRDAQIPTPPWRTFGPGEAAAAAVEESIGYPCAVKPTGCGSSVGVSLVYRREELLEALRYVDRYGQAVLVEQLVPGREFSVGILEGQALPVIEIVPRDGFYDYRNKYQTGGAQEICPARLTAEETAKIQDLALGVHRVLQLGSYSRVDFILDSQGTFWCLEANTLPGMTPTSLLPQEAAQVGITYPQLCARLAESASKTE